MTAARTAVMSALRAIRAVTRMTVGPLVSCCAEASRMLRRAESKAVVTKSLAGVMAFRRFSATRC